MKKYWRKMIAPIIITVLVVLYYVAFFAIFLQTVEASLAVRLAVGLTPLIPAGVCIYVLCERIKEIRSGEEDDLSKY